MARELENINSSGELEVIKLGGTADGNKLLTSDEIDTKDSAIGTAANSYTDTQIAAINTDWGVITSASQEPDASMKVGDWYTSSINEALTNFDGVVPLVGQRVYKTGESTYGVGSAGSDYDYFSVPYSGARTDVDLGDNDILAANVNKLQYGVFAYLTTPTNTSVETGGTYVPVSGTFTNLPSEGFTVVADPAIQFTADANVWFEIDWHASFECTSANQTVSFGIKKNGTLLDSSVMTNFSKNADQIYSASGTVVTQMIQDDKIQLVMTTSGNLQVVLVDNFTATIKAFITPDPVVGP